jgi:hypothetical protein
MKTSRGLHYVRYAALAALAAFFLGSSSATSAGAGQTQDRSAVTSAADSDDGSEHGENESPEIKINWILPAATGLLQVYAPTIRLELLGLHVKTPLEVEVRTLEDAGSMQSRRVGKPIRETLVAPHRLEIPISFGADLPVCMTHSGMVVAVVRACEIGGGCITGTSEPLFFHPDGGGFLVYDEQVLCQRFGCGALTGGGSPERGTWRVMGGGPLHAAPSREETADEDDDRTVDGGDV